MRFVLFVVALSHLLFAFEYKAQMGMEYRGYNNYEDEFIRHGKAKLSFENELFRVDSSLEFLYSSEYAQKRYLLLNELYISKEFDQYEVSFGKKINYFGELEGYNVADIYNRKNSLQDPFDKSAKYGTIGADLTRYFDENSFTFGAKLYEADTRYAQKGTPYAPFALAYQKELQLSNSRYTPSFYFMVNLTSQEFVESETKLLLYHGYDTKRDVVLQENLTLREYAYRVNKAVLLSHILYEDTLLKMELSYTDVIDYDAMSDYAQLSGGVEKSFYAVLGDADVTLYGEYYRYLYVDDTKQKYKDSSEIYDNDLFVALRLSFNDVRGSELRCGVLQDLQKKERVTELKYNTRIADSFMFHTEYLYIQSATHKSLLAGFDKSSRFVVGVDYTF